MTILCALSGEAPEHPVVSTKSGNIYERRLIEKHLAESETDPVNGEPLTVDDLIDLKLQGKTVRPRPPSATSLPALLRLFQDEWDAAALETFSLQQTLETTRQELAHALYQQDAACRVIARLTRERDAARSSLASLSAKLGHVDESKHELVETHNVPMEGIQEDLSIPQEVVSLLDETQKKLVDGRKKRKKSPELATKKQLTSYTEVFSHSSLHGKSVINAFDINMLKPELTVTAGKDKKAVVYDRNNKKILSTLKGHTNALTDVKFHPSEPLIVTSSDDKTSIVWDYSSSSAQKKATIKTHSSAVTSLDIHPCEKYFVTSSSDGSWALNDLYSGETYLTTSSDSKISCARFHPDGFILATGTLENVVRLWDVKSQTIPATFDTLAPVSSVSFSENGYYFATGSQDGNVKLWDLRKLSNIQTINVDSAVNSVQFDYSGSYIAVGSADVRIMTAKPWEHVVTYEQKKRVSSVKFGPNASYIASAVDNTLLFTANV